MLVGDLSKVLMVDDLRRRGLSSEAISDLCLMCGQERETMDHLFVHCKLSFTLWKKFSSRCGVLWSAPSSLAWWRLGVWFLSLGAVLCFGS